MLLLHCRNFTGLLRRLFPRILADEQVAHQRAAVRAVHGARGVEAELVGVAAQAVILGSALPADDGDAPRGAAAALAVVGEADHVFHAAHLTGTVPSRSIVAYSPASR